MLCVMSAVHAVLMGVEVSECLWWFPSSDGFLGGVALGVGVFLVLVLALVVLWFSMCGR